MRSCRSSSADTRRGRRLACAAAALLLSCAGAGPGPESCRIEIVRPESEVSNAFGVEVSYRVRGYAGTPGVVSLVARRRDGGFLSGKGIEVGPGEFVAIVEQKLTGPAAGYVVLLEVADGRCMADVKDG